MVAQHDKSRTGAKHRRSRDEAPKGTEMSDKDNPFGGRAASIPPMSATAPPSAAAHATAPAAAAAGREGRHDRELCRRRHPGIAQAAGAGRFLGAVVRPVQAAAAGAGKGRGRGRRRGQAGQDEHRRTSGDRRPARHPVDSGGHRLQERPAGRRLHGRHSRKPDPRVHPEARRQGRRPAADRRGACRGQAGARGGRPADAPPTSTTPCCRRQPDNVDAIAGLADLLFEAGDTAGAEEVLARAPADKQDAPAIAAVRTKIALAARGREPRRSGRVRAPACRRIPGTIRRASTSP